MEEEEEGQAFAIPDWWRPSAFALNYPGSEPTLFGAVEFDVPSIKLDNPYAPEKPLENSLQLPDLEAFAFGPLPELDPIEDLALSDSEHTESWQGQDDDIWKIALDLGPLENDVKYYTWESFSDARHQEPRSAYISDAGAEVFDAALKAQVHPRNATISTGVIVQSKVMLNSLIALGLGLESVLFSWDKKTKAFVENVDNVRMSDFSLQSTQDLLKRLIRTGNMTRNLRALTEKTYASPTTPSARVALASSIQTTLNAIESHLLPKIAGVKSLLQLKQLFERPHSLLNCILDLTHAVKGINDDSQLASILYTQLQTLDQEDDMIHGIISSIIAHVCGPSLEMIGSWTGLSPPTSNEGWSSKAGGFVEVISKQSDQERATMDEYSYRSDGMPLFISYEDSQTVFEIGNSIRMLRYHHPQHPLSDPTRHGITPPTLDWKFGWDEIGSIASKANAYESALTAAVLEFGRKNLQHIDTILEKKSMEDVNDRKPLYYAHDLGKYILDTAELLDAAPQDLYTVSDELQQLVLEHLNGSILPSTNAVVFAPPLLLTSTLSFQPLFTTQARLVNAATLRLLFHSHKLRTHLSLQRNYHLLGDGVFLSRLTSSLFSSTLSSAERQRGSLRLGTTMGLRLTSRKTWPPASSELRLALMGLLSETYSLSTLGRHNASPTSTEPREKDSVSLPGDLSFAIRQLSQEEIDRCMNPNSLYALDFLRLQYTPPSPLHTVISTAALDKYDSVFKFLLRLTRMQFVISHLPRASKADRRMRIEAHHFVNCCCAYFFDGVRESWDAFEGYLDGIERAIAQEDAAGVLGRRVNEGIESLRNRHERVLDRICFRLLLRGRQRQVMGLLEEIFEGVLGFACGDAEGADLAYAAFKEKVLVFLTVCRGLVGKRGYGKTRSEGSEGGEENTIERLVLLLEMNGYWAGEPMEDVWAG